MRTVISLTLLAILITATPSHAVQCHKGQGAEVTLDFQRSEDGSPKLDFEMIVVSERCTKGLTTYQIDGLVGFTFDSLYDAQEWFAKIIRVTELKLKDEKLLQALAFAEALKAKVKPVDPAKDALPLKVEKRK